MLIEFKPTLYTMYKNYKTYKIYSHKSEHAFLKILRV